MRGRDGYGALLCSPSAACRSASTLLSFTDPLHGIQTRLTYSLVVSPKNAYKYSRMLIILLFVFPINLLCFTMWPPADLTCSKENIVKNGSFVQGTGDVRLSRAISKHHPMLSFAVTFFFSPSRRFPAVFSRLFRIARYCVVA